jgi:cellobiose-specific phosphotransferase system component IIB
MSITTRQNESAAIAKLAAQRHLYTTAKRVFFTQAVIVAPLALVGSLVAMSHPAAKPYFALWGFLFAAIDLLLITPWIHRMKETAAKIQETFDTYVLAIPWNDIKVGKRPDVEAIKEHSDSYFSFRYAGGNVTFWSLAAWPFKKAWAVVSTVMKFFAFEPAKYALEDWYSIHVAEVPEVLGKIICQRTNCAYDLRVRKCYSTWLLGLSIVAAAAIVALPLVNGFSAQDLVVASLAPAAPVLLFGVRNFREHLQAAAKAVRIKEGLERVWREALAGKDEATLAPQVRCLQDEIYDHRRGSPMVFDSVYNWMRGKLERQAEAGAVEMVSEATAAIKATKV